MPFQKIFIENITLHFIGNGQWQWLSLLVSNLVPKISNLVPNKNRNISFQKTEDIYLNIFELLCLVVSKIQVEIVFFFNFLSQKIIFFSKKPEHGKPVTLDSYQRFDCQQPTASGCSIFDRRKNVGEKWSRNNHDEFSENQERFVPLHDCRTANRNQPSPP